MVVQDEPRTETIEVDSVESARPQHGQTDLRRRLDERHVNMIAFSATIGIGLFLQSGKVIYLIGPGGAVMAYLLMGSVLWSCVASLGEMTAIFPVRGPIIDFPSRFIDESVGFAVGWMAWFAYVILVATEVSAIAQLFNFKYQPDYLRLFNYPQESLGWEFGQQTSPAVWVGIFLLAILLINFLPVRAYGELEYWFGCFKMTVISLLILFNVVLNAQNTAKGKQRRFEFYDSPYGFFSANSTTSSPTRTYTFHGDTGRLVGMWSSLNTIFFSLMGFFTVSITAAENVHLEKNESIKLATRKISLRVMLLYSLFVFTVGLNVPYNDPGLVDNTISSIRRGEYSALVISCVRGGVTGFPHLFNAFYIFSAFSTGINALYVSSRLLHALANIRNVWPNWSWAQSIKRRLERTTSKGVPATAVFVSWLFGFAGFLAVRPSPAKILGRMAINTTASMLIVYSCVCLSFLVFKTRTVNGPHSGSITIPSPSGHLLNRNAPTYPYKSHFQYLRALYGLIACGLLAIFNGWRSFLNPFSAADFIASYISVVVFIFLVSAYHVKEEGWNPMRWGRRYTMDTDRPLEVQEGAKRKGQFSRVDKSAYLSAENAKGLAQWVWVWMK
ncbi:MAG: hypothetical protein M1814_000636 [Vezdaea aestivalis]|nr:MAG: hypothetical protein M1814_000636 [Vezdaea aestivalis]